jgi:hypothetical protein
MFSSDQSKASTDLETTDLRLNNKMHQSIMSLLLKYLLLLYKVYGNIFIIIGTSSNASTQIFGMEMPVELKVVGCIQRWADRYFGPLVRCPADYRNVSGPADWKK